MHGRVILVILSCRKLWEGKEVRAASVRQGKRYAERWCAARVPLKQAVARLLAKGEPAATLSRTEIQQQRRLAAIPNPKLYRS